MKTASLKEIKNELKHASQEEMMEYCLRLVKFKKENKELLTYLLFEADNDHLYIQSIKKEMDMAFGTIHPTNSWIAKKNVRKILSQVKRNIRYAQNKEVEIELLIYFCQKMTNTKGLIQQNKVLQNTLETQLRMIRRAIDTLHPDLQLDYASLLEEFDN